MRISDWSPDVCSSDLRPHARTGPVRDSAKATPASPADHQSIGLGGKPMRNMEQHPLAVDQRFGLVAPETPRSANGKKYAQHLHGRAAIPYITNPNADAHPNRTALG